MRTRAHNRRRGLLLHFDKRRAVRFRRKRRSRKFYQKKEFLAEQKKWYDKLKKEGFQDIELIDWETGRVYERTMGVSQADIVNTWTREQEEYYRLAAQFVHALREAGKESKEAIRIWELHAEGLGYRKIAKKLGVPKSRVERVVPRLKKQMLEAREDWDEAEWAEEWLAAQLEE